VLEGAINSVSSIEYSITFYEDKKVTHYFTSEFIEKTYEGN